MHLLSVNIGQERSIEKAKASGKTGIYKQPAPGDVTITPDGIPGDFIADIKHHGGPDQALYLYGGADYDWWSRQLGRVVAPGSFGENLTVSDLESARCSIGDRLRIGNVLLEVSAPRMPCVTLARRMGDPQFIQRFRDAERPGLYCRVLQPGTLRAGDEVRLEPVRGAAVGVIEIYRDHYEQGADADALRRFLDAPLAIRTRKALEERLGKLLVG